MPKIHTPLSPSRLRLRVLHRLVSEPGHYNVGTLAEALGENYMRVRDAVADVDEEFGVIRSGPSHLMTVTLPGQAVVV